MTVARDGRARLGPAGGSTSSAPSLQAGRRVGGGAALPVPAPQPVRPESAERAFAAAKTAADQRATTSLGEIVVTSAAGGDLAAVGSDAAAAEGASRLVAGRRFEMRRGVWTDVGHVKGSDVVRVRPFGAAYFRLLELVPELREAFAIGDRVLVAGRSISVEVAPDAPETLDLSTLARVERDW
jgi:hypothetical protein